MMRMLMAALFALVASCSLSGESHLFLSGARGPNGAIDARGDLHVVAAKDNAILVVTSRAGSGHEPLVEVARFSFLAAGRGSGPKIAATSRGLCIVAIAGDRGGGKSGDVQSFASSDARTWTGPVRVNRTADSAREGLHALASDGDGRLLCVWLDLRNEKMELFGAASRDGGRTWTEDALVYAAPEGSICECCAPSVAFAPDGSAVVLWRNHVGSDRDPWLARLPDGVPQRVDGTRLGKTGWRLDACPMDGGGVGVASDGSFTTAWRRDRTIYVSRGADDEERLADGRLPTVAAGVGGAWIAWLAEPGPTLTYRDPRTNAVAHIKGAASEPALVASQRDGVWAVWTAVDGVRCARLDEPGH